MGERVTPSHLRPATNYSGNAACAHLRVVYVTQTATGGLTTGWWQCSDCGRQYNLVPFVAATPEREPPPGEAESFIERAVDTFRQILAEDPEFWEGFELTAMRAALMSLRPSEPLHKGTDERPAICAVCGAEWDGVEQSWRPVAPPHEHSTHICGGDDNLSEESKAEIQGFTEYLKDKAARIREGRALTTYQEWRKAR